MALSIAAVVAIGHALWISEGHYDIVSLYWVSAGILLTWGAMLISVGGSKVALGVCAGGLVWQIVECLHQDPLGEVVAPLSYYSISVPILAAGAMGAVMLPRLSRKMFVPLLLVTYFAAGVALISQAPKPFIDVYSITQESCRALAHGQDPYAITVPDIYQTVGKWETAFYEPGMVVNGRLQFGYQYMPLSLYVAFAGYEASGDFRYGNLLAVTIAAGLLAYCRRDWMGAAGAALLLLTPKGYYVIDHGWSEPVIVLGGAAVVFCACRVPKLLPWAVGLLLASKQHMVLAAPLAILTLPRPWRWKMVWEFYLKAGIAAAVITLPMVMWNPRAFWHSAVVELLRNPFRDQSLNFAAAWVHGGGPPPPTWMAVAVFAAAMGVALWRAPRNVFGFGIALAVVYLSLFALAKQAFCNYYFFCIGALCCGIAAASFETHEDGKEAGHLKPQV